MDGKANESAAWRSGLSGLSGLGDGSLASLRFHFTVDFQEENHGKSWKIIRLPLGVPNLGSMYRGVCVCAGVLADEMGVVSHNVNPRLINLVDQSVVSPNKEL